MRWLISLVVMSSLGASYRTPNFIVSAESPEFAQNVAEAAEFYRSEHAKHWLGAELPKWSQPCPIRVQVGENLGAGGATGFVFDGGEVFNWSMSVQGTHERIIDAVLPHEVLHAVFASHFRQPLPRWADEGACTTVECKEELQRHHRMLESFLREGRGIATGKLVTLKEYPQDVMPLYAQGYVMCRFLLDQRGRPAFVNYLADGLQDNDWRRATEAHYGYADLTEFQADWLAWFKGGMKPVTQLAAYAPKRCAECEDPASGGMRPSHPGTIRPATPYLEQPFDSKPPLMPLREDPQPPQKVAQVVPVQPIAQQQPAKGCDCDPNKAACACDESKLHLAISSLESKLGELASKQPAKGDTGPPGPPPSLAIIEQAIKSKLDVVVSNATKPIAGQGGFLKGAGFVGSIALALFGGAKVFGSKSK